MVCRGGPGDEDPGLRGWGVANCELRGASRGVRVAVCGLRGVRVQEAVRGRWVRMTEMFVCRSYRVWTQQ
jgi:hypothetical protein